MTSLAVLFLLLDLEALAALLWTFFTPSESGQGVFLWLSPMRLVLVAALIVIWLAMVTVTVWLRRSEKNAASRLADFDARLVDQRHLVPALVVLLALPLLLILAAWGVLATPVEYDIYKTWAPDTFPLLHSLVLAILPLLAFTVLACVEIGLFLVLRHRRVLITTAIWDWKRSCAAFFVLLALALTLFHWLVLAFQLRFFVNLPAWYWIFDPVPLGIGDVLFALGALVLIGLSYWLLFVKNQAVACLFCVAALGLFLQFGVGLMGGGGIATLRDRYFTTYHQAYILKASESHLTVLEGIRGYESLYGSSPFTSTKPPGLMAFYIGLDHLVNGYPSVYDNAARYERLSNLVIWLFPILAVSIVFLIYLFARRLLEDSSGLVQRAAPWLYVLAPSLALFTFFADQAVYPLIFLLGVWLTVIAVRRGTFAWALFLGAALYAAVFFAFTMLPLYPFAGLYLLLHIWRERPDGRFKQLALLTLAIAVGTLAMHALSLTLLNYDFLPRFERTMSINHNFDFYLRVGQQPPAGPESMSVRLGQILKAAWINNLDFAAAIGFPLYMLFLVQVMRRLVRFFRGQVPPGDIILLALVSAFLVLNLAGTAQGEVPRLWLFWLPTVALLAACELQPHLARRPYAMLALAMLQVITLMLTFHFQDLRM